MTKSSNSTKQKWNDIIAKKLKAGTVIEDLYHEYPGGITMPPNVVAAEVEASKALKGLTPWVNMATIVGEDAGVVNGLILQSLNHGASGLDLRLKKAVDMSQVMKDVLTEYLDVRIDCGTWSAEEIKKQKQNLPVSNFPNVRWISGDGYQQVQITAKERIESTVAAFQLIEHDRDCDVIVSMGKNFLFEVASLRAIRQKMEERHTATFNIIARYDVEGTNELGDYDLIEKTYKVMSGVLGCSDAVLTDYNGDEGSRLSLNIHNILELESAFKSVLDPVGGSYYIEKLVSEIMSKI